MKKVICIFGASSDKVADEYKEAAFEVGRLIAEKGYSMVFGAGDKGIMGAAARGAHSADGEIIGVAPELFDQPGILYENCTELIITPTMHIRKDTMERRSNAFITLAGGFGTFEELMEVLTLKQLGYIDAPIIILNTLGYYDNILAMFNKCVDENFADERYLKLFSVAETPEEALSLAENYVQSDMPLKYKQ